MPISHQWIKGKLGREISTIHSEGPHIDHDGQAFKHLVIVSNDSPEVDSHVKQLASHVGELTNHPATAVLKEGKGGPQGWTIANKLHDGGTAHPAAISFWSGPTPGFAQQ